MIKYLTFPQNARGCLDICCVLCSYLASLKHMGNQHAHISSGNMHTAQPTQRLKEKSTKTHTATGSDAFGSSCPMRQWTARCLQSQALKRGVPTFNHHAGRDPSVRRQKLNGPECNVAATRHVVFTGLTVLSALAPSTYMNNLQLIRKSM